ncbi:sigma-70 family RNA polymerase sigma factor (plasmid) [Saccharothrix sp. AJ9571]|nr:sigma-70 family RNA polymerase sigma factor [Saccharothrix sp. AJ9571]
MPAKTMYSTKDDRLAAGPDEQGAAQSTQDTDKLSRLQKARQRVDAARETAAAAKKAATPVLFRNRRALRPWYAAAGTAALGSVGSAATEFTDVPVDLMIAGGTGAVALGSSWLLYKRYGEQIAKADMDGRVKAGIAGACAWCATAPLTGVSQLEMWLALGLGTVALSARWWQRIRPALRDPAQAAGAGPVADDQSTTTAESAAAGEVDELQAAAEKIIEEWTNRLGVAGGPLAGTNLSDPTLFGGTAQFTVYLVPGKQSAEDLRTDAMMRKISGAIGHFPEMITIDRGDHPSQASMTVVLSRAATPYEGPKIVHEDGSIYIEIGPYEDGLGTERYHVASPGSINGGFVLGSKGSGKSRLLELIAIGLRKLGIEIWWFDPQEGASSAALKERADWPIMGVSKGSDPVGNIRMLLQALERVIDIRQKENVVSGNDSFTHTPERPAIVVIIDECHKVFNVADPLASTTTKFGHYFGELDRVMRKLGISILAASQIFTIETFGNAAALRSGLITGNLLVMRMMEKSHCGLLPGEAPSPLGLPKGGGYGFSIDSDRPHAMWRGEYVQDPAAWLAKLPSAKLDRRAVKAAGQPYRDRFLVAKQHTEAAKAALEAFDAADDATATSLLAPPAIEPPVAAASPAGAVVQLPVRPSARTGENTSGERPPADLPTAPVSPAAQRVLIVLSDGQDWHVNDIAEVLAISPQAVRGHIRTLGETRLTKVGSGVYRAK